MTYEWSATPGWRDHLGLYGIGDFITTPWFEKGKSQWQVKRLIQSSKRHLRRY